MTRKPAGKLRGKSVLRSDYDELEAESIRLDKTIFPKLSEEYSRFKIMLEEYIYKWFYPLFDDYLKSAISADAERFILDAANSIRNCQIRDNEEDYFEDVEEAAYHIRKYAGVSELYEVCYYISENFDELKEIMDKNKSRKRR